jgi:hypothetical protein
MAIVDFSRRSNQAQDTPEEIDRVQIELLKMAGNPLRLRKALQLSDLVKKMSRRAIARRHPELSANELDLLYVEYCYGRELAQKLRAYLSR